MVLQNYKRQYTSKTLTLRKCMCMRASEASELRKFRYFYILKLLFLSIFCRYIRCFVGTNDMLVGLHVPTNLSMYRQISKCTDKSPKRHYWGGGALPPPPPLATLMHGPLNTILAQFMDGRSPKLSLIVPRNSRLEIGQIPKMTVHKKLLIK